ncbi:MAG: radical SAM protein [Deltaproteobacteria bacterium]|nr:radical SAM protein [Deltaproteobacteria bacterium]
MSVETAQRYDFEVGMYRPPSEGGSHSLLVRVTRNCPWNRCEFCAMYKSEKFSLRTPAEVKQDIDHVAAISRRLLGDDKAPPHVTREAALRLVKQDPWLGGHYGFDMVFNWLASGGKTAFLQDANSLIMKTNQLVEILQHLRQTFPSLERVTSYARSRTLAQKPLQELAAIHMAGLDRLHVGLETGDEDLLMTVRKGVTGAGHVKGGRKAMEAGFQLSEYWMPGLGGREMADGHARNTAAVLNRIDPHYIRSRPFFPAPGTPLSDRYASGEFTRQSPHEQLMELKTMMEALDVTSRVCFDHAGNYWTDRRGGLLFSQSYEGYKFPEEKPLVLALIEEGLAAN